MGSLFILFRKSISKSGYHPRHGRPPVLSIRMRNSETPDRLLRNLSKQKVFVKNRKIITGTLREALLSTFMAICRHVRGKYKKCVISAFTKHIPYMR